MDNLPTASTSNDANNFQSRINSTFASALTILKRYNEHLVNILDDATTRSSDVISEMEIKYAQILLDQLKV